MCHCSTLEVLSTVVSAAQTSEPPVLLLLFLLSSMAATRAPDVAVMVSSDQELEGCMLPGFASPKP